MRFIVWTKIVYHNVCMVNTDKGQEGIVNIIEARNKNKMLLACKEEAAFITKATRISEYNRKCVIMQLRRSEKERKGGAERKKIERGSCANYSTGMGSSRPHECEVFSCGDRRWIADLENKDDRPKTPAERLLASPEVNEENKQSIKATAEECNLVKISVKLKVMLDKFYERLARRENIYD